MRREIFWAVLVLLSLVVFIACSDGDQDSVAGGDNDVETQADGDKDGDTSGDVDKDLADFDLESDADGDADEDLADPDEDAEPDAEPDVDKIDAEPEPELEPESEIEQGPAYDIHIEEFPFEATTIVPCSDTLNKAEPHGVWGDDAGRIYFAGASDPENGVAPFWIYDEANDTFTCDLNVTETLFDVKGRIVAGQPEVWVEVKDKIGRLHQGSWTFISIPDVDPFTDDDKLMHAGIDVSATGKIAVWGDWGLGFYDPATEVWTKLEFCDGMDTGIVIVGYWVGEKFYMPGGCDLYEIDPAAPACDVLATLDGCDRAEEYFLKATGVVDNKLWLAYNAILNLDVITSGIKEIFTIDVDNDVSFIPLELDADKCSDIWEAYEGGDPSSSLRYYAYTLPGSAGTPIIFEVFKQIIYSLGCGANLQLNVSALANNVSCGLSNHFAHMGTQESILPCFVHLRYKTLPSRMWRASANSSWIVERSVIPSEDEGGFIQYDKMYIPGIVHVTWDEPADKNK